MRQLFTILSTGLLFLSAEAIALPTSTIQCYINPYSKKIETIACMKGRCVDYSEQVCEPNNTEDTAALKYYNSKTGEFLLAGEYPCSNAEPRILCKTYRGPAKLKL